MNNTLKPLYWAGSPPQECDVCQQPIAGVFYDAKIPHGSWACLCKDCFTRLRCALGTGKGQKYQPASDGRWQKTGG